MALPPRRLLLAAGAAALLAPPPCAATRVESRESCDECQIRYMGLQESLPDVDEMQHWQMTCEGEENRDCFHCPVCENKPKVWWDEASGTVPERWGLAARDFGSKGDGSAHHLEKNFVNTCMNCFLNSALQLILHDEELLGFLTSRNNLLPVAGNHMDVLIRDVKWIYEHYRGQVVPHGVSESVRRRLADLGMANLQGGMATMEDALIVFKTIFGKYQKPPVFAYEVRGMSVDTPCTKDNIFVQPVAPIGDAEAWTSTQGGCRQEKREAPYEVPVFPLKGKDVALPKLFSKRREVIGLQSNEDANRLFQPEAEWFECKANGELGKKFHKEDAVSSWLCDKSGNKIDLTGFRKICLDCNKGVDDYRGLYKYVQETEWIIPDTGVLLVEFIREFFLPFGGVKTTTTKVTFGSDGEVRLPVRTAAGQQVDRVYHVKGCLLKSGDAYGGHWVALLRLQRGWVLADDTKPAVKDAPYGLKKCQEATLLLLAAPGASAGHTPSSSTLTTTSGSPGRRGLAAGGPLLALLLAAPRLLASWP